MPAMEKMLRSPDQPRLTELVQEYNRCSSTADGFDRNADAERVRFARWANQSWDCKKKDHGQFKAKPWNGASDQRVMLADEVVGDEVAVLLGAFDRVALQAEALGSDDLETAGAAQRILRWYMRSRAVRELRRTVELSAQYFATYGWVVLNPVWERQIGRRRQFFSREQIAQVLGEQQMMLLQDPAMVEEAATLILDLWRVYVAQELAGTVDVDEISGPTKADAKRYLEELNNKGGITLPMPYLVRNLPRIRALRPWHEIRVPDQTGDLQRGNAYVVEYITVDQLHAYAISEGWDAKWVEKAEEQCGRRSDLFTPEITVRPAAQTEYTVDPGSSLIEVVTAYTWRLDADGIPAIYCTVFSPFVKSAIEGEDLVAKHGILDYLHGRMPLVEGALEWWCPDVTASRGLPEQAYPAQRTMKVMEDALVDRTTITVLPPRLVPAEMMDMEDVFGPASRVPVRPGREPRFMDIPPNDGVAERIWLSAENRLARQLGRVHESVPPIISTARMQKRVTEFLTMWVEAFQQTWALMAQYMTDPQWVRILGTPKPRFDPAALAEEAGTMMSFDVREMDSEFSLKQMDAISKTVLPEDSAGVIDRSELVRKKLSMIHPALARSLVQSKAGATQQVYERVAADFASMALGNPPRMVEKDPTTPMQIEFAQQILQANPKYQQALQGDALFQQHVEAWFKNRQMGAMQERNKVVGRLGVEPNGGAQ